MILGIVLGYLAISLAVGWRAGKGSSASSDGFVAGDRTLGTFVMYFITGATIFSAFAFLGQPAAVYTKGASAFALLGYGCLGFVPFYWLGPRAARVGRAYGYVTQGEMVAGRFQSPALAIVMALVAIVAFVPYLALQMQGAGIVLEAITGGDIGPDVGAALVYGVVLMYVWRSGVLGVGWTNALQGILMMVLAWILGLTVPELMHGGVDEMFDGLVQRDPKMLVPPGYTGTPEPGVVAPWTWSQYSSRLVVMMIGFSFWPHLFMKAFTARNGDVLRRTVVLYPTFLLFLVPIFLLGFAAIGMENPPASADGILPHLILNLDLSPVLVGLFCAGALAASMSSGDSILHAAASILVRDGGVRGLRLDLSPERERGAIRALLVVVALVSYLFAVGAFGEFHIVSLLVFAYGPVGQLAPVVIATLCWRRATRHGLLAGLAVGSATIVVCEVMNVKLPVHTGLLALGLNAITLVLVSICTGQREPARHERFIDTANQPTST
tara:strand:+ start:1051 stop:2538 length:1488 start_codon:yes stop_codon:yes gene_type:complete